MAWLANRLAQYRISHILSPKVPKQAKKHTRRCFIAGAKIVAFVSGLYTKRPFKWLNTLRKKQTLAKLKCDLLLLGWVYGVCLWRTTALMGLLYLENYDGQSIT